MQSIFGRTHLRIKEYVYCNAKQINLPKLAEFEKSLEVTINHDSQDYLTEFVWMCVIEKDEWFRLMRHLNRKLVSNLGLERMMTRNRVFDPSEAVDFAAMGFQMWPGYYHNLISRDCGIMMSIKSLH